MDGRRRQSSSSRTIDFFQASSICQKRIFLMVIVMKLVKCGDSDDWVLGWMSSPTGSSTDLPLRKCVYALRNSWIGGSTCTSFRLPTHIEISSNRWHTVKFATASTLQLFHIYHLQRAKWWMPQPAHVFPGNEMHLPKKGKIIGTQWAQVCLPHTKMLTNLNLQTQTAIRNHLRLQFEGTSLWYLRLPKLFYIAWFTGVLV